MIDSLFGVESFQANSLSHQDPVGRLTSKYNSGNVGNPQCLSNRTSRFERDPLHRMKKLCAASTDEDDFMMSKDEAIKLLQETYSGSIQVTKELRISDWQAVNHIYHGNGVDVNSTPLNDRFLDIKEL